MPELDLLKKITILDNKTAFVVRSNAISVYPTANRGQDVQETIAKPINLESRLQTEYNIATAKPIKTFIEEVHGFNSTDSNRFISFYLNGYYFKINGINSNELLSIVADDKINFCALIHYSETTLVSPDQKTKVLLSWKCKPTSGQSTTNTVYEFNLDTDGYFYGLVFTAAENIPADLANNILPIFIYDEENECYKINNNKLLPTISTYINDNTGLSDYKYDNITSSSAGIILNDTENRAAIFSIAEGRTTKATGENSHTEGYNTKASKPSAHAEGSSTTASGNNAHAEGYNTAASETSSHAEGRLTLASGKAAHAEGIETRAIIDGTHAEGCATKASGDYSHAEGTGKITNNAVVFGDKISEEVIDEEIIYTYKYDTINNVVKVGSTLSIVIENKRYYLFVKSITSTDDNKTIAFTCSDTSFLAPNNLPNAAAITYNIASGTAAHAEGSTTTASGTAAHAEGSTTTASGTAAHAEGDHTTASGTDAHAEGDDTTASGDNSHAEGYYTTASGNSSHAEGKETTASREAAHAEGLGPIASGNQSHAEGYYVTASGANSHAEGRETEASAESAHAEGAQTNALEIAAHAEGSHTTASGRNSHAEGYHTTASKLSAHAEGRYTKADGQAAHAEGDHTTATGTCQHVFGRYNKSNSTVVEIVGNGASGAPSNARTLDWDGNEWLAGNLELGTADNRGTLIGKTSFTGNPLLYHNMNSYHTMEIDASHSFIYIECKRVSGSWSYNWWPLGIFRIPKERRMSYRKIVDCDGFGEDPINPIICYLEFYNNGTQLTIGFNEGEEPWADGENMDFYFKYID